MPFVEVISTYIVMIFRMVSDGFSLIFSHQWSAFSFMSVFLLGCLAMLAALVPSVRDVAFGTDRMIRDIERGIRLDRRAMERDVISMKRAERDREREQRRLEADQRRQAIDMERATKKRIASNRDAYAQMLLNTRDYEQSRFVTIEGKRYYRKGLVSRGQRLNSSDRDYSHDLDTVDNEI